MATSSTTKLTEYQTAVTVVTAEVANMWFGGLYGTTEGNSKSDTDPLVAGHCHDGAHQDGSSQKINLVNHVTGQLRNVNVANDAVTKRTVASFTSQGQAIPEYEIISGTTYYYLDLSLVYAAIPNTFSSIAISANGGTVTGDGSTSLSADTTSDTLLIQAGAGIEIETTAASDLMVIKATGSTSNSFETHTFGASGGTGSGGPVVADSSTDTLSWLAGPGIIIAGDATTDSVTISATSDFGDIAVQSATGGSSSGTNVQADVSYDTVTLEAGAGMHIETTPASDLVSYRNRYAFSHGVLGLPDWTGGWGSVASETWTDTDTLTYKYTIADTDYIYSSIPIPSSELPDQPLSVVIRAYFVSKNSSGGAGYLEGLVTKPQFSIDLELGSNENQLASIEYGTVTNLQDILAGGQDLFSPAVNVTSSNVTAERQMHVISWPAQLLTIGSNNIGLLFLRMKGVLNFSGGQAFDTVQNDTAELHFLKADFTWYYT